MHLLAFSLYTIVACSSSVSAQFGFFEQMFHGNQNQQHLHRQGGAASSLAAQYDALQCSEYVCPTLACVSTPADCPCPYVEDIKCVVPDGQDKGAATVLCVRGETECEEIERLANR